MENVTKLEMVKHADGYLVTEAELAIMVTRNGITYPRCRFAVVAIPAGAEARKYAEGPMVPGPWADTYPLASVLALVNGSNVHTENLKARGLLHVVKGGELFEIDGEIYAARIFRGDYIALDHVNADEKPEAAREGF